MSRIKEKESYAEIGTFLHVDKGQARIKAYTSVNEPLKVDASELTKKVGKVRVRMVVEEDKSVQNDGSFYEKNVDAVQERDDGDVDHQNTRSSKVYTPQEDPDVNDTVPTNGHDKFSVLKNFVDNIASDNRIQWMAILGVAILVIAVAVVMYMR